jgi:hypothetical protein
MGPIFKRVPSASQQNFSYGKIFGKPAARLPAFGARRSPAALIWEGNARFIHGFCFSSAAAPVDDWHARLRADARRPREGGPGDDAFLV